MDPGLADLLSLADERGVPTMGLGEGAENGRLATSVYTTRPSVKKCRLHSLKRLNVSYTM